jgi:hypothetical protein
MTSNLQHSSLQSQLFLSLQRISTEGLNITGLILILFAGDAPNIAAYLNYEHTKYSSYILKRKAIFIWVFYLTSPIELLSQTIRTAYK